MPVVILASFPNSRIKNRSPRSQGFTDIVTIAMGSPAQLVVPLNPDRTDLVLRNLDSLQSCFYGYLPTIDGTTIGEGFELKPLESIDIVTTQNVYVYNPGPLPMNVVFDEGSG